MQIFNLGLYLWNVCRAVCVFRCLELIELFAHHCAADNMLVVIISVTTLHAPVSAELRIVSDLALTH